jgi:23S rRNA (pseudouridine1915-N3)-methyltransferase
MHLRIVAVGKLRDPSVAAICAEFGKRLRPYHRVELTEVRASAGSDRAKAVREEGERIVKAAGGGPLWLLDRTGDELASEELAAKLAALEMTTSSLALVIGGAFGVAPAVRDRASFVWSLSQLTFLHEWARMIVLEQLYRAAKIARSEPYHH